MDGTCSPLAICLAGSLCSCQLLVFPGALSPGFSARFRRLSGPCISQREGQWEPLQYQG